MKFYLFISFLICLPLLSFGYEDNDYLEKELTPQTIDKADWEEATKGLDYGEEKIEKPKKQNKEQADLSFLGPLIKIIGIGCVVVLIAFLLYSFVGLQGIESGKSKKFDPNATIDTQTVAENIHEFDLPALIQQAIQQKEYTKATRLYYLLAIKTLSDKELIKWKKEKTNRTYLNELPSGNLKYPFRELTNIFDRVWYGEATINESIFQNIEGQFRAFIDNIAKV